MTAQVLTVTPMELALAAAGEAAALGEVPVGAVILRDGVVLARAHNRTILDRDPTAHAEILAIRAACVKLGSERLIGCDLYVTLEPCAMCAAAISFARIRRLYWGCDDPKGGAVDSGARFFGQPTCHHAPEAYGGFRATEAQALLTGFFAARRVPSTSGVEPQRPSEREPNADDGKGHGKDGP